MSRRTFIKVAENNPSVGKTNVFGHVQKSGIFEAVLDDHGWYNTVSKEAHNFRVGETGVTEISGLDARSERDVPHSLDDVW